MKLSTAQRDALRTVIDHYDRAVQSARAPHRRRRKDS